MYGGQSRFVKPYRGYPTRSRARLSGPAPRRGRKVYRKKLQRRYTPSKIIVRQPSGLPDRCFVKLRYTVSLFFTSLLGNISGQQFRGNGPFDPDVTGVGGQPYLYDQWSSFYNRYRVRASKIRCRLTQPPAASGSYASSITLAVVPRGDTGVFAGTSYEQIREQPYARYITTRGAGNRDPEIKHYMSTAKIFGLNKAAVNGENDYCEANTTTVPTIQWYWNVEMWGTDQATSTAATPIDITVTYYMEFFNRVTSAIS